MTKDCFIFPEMDQRSSRKNEANRRRFNEEQIKYLEFMFEAESRPESQMKEQVACELGLEPRQVSIWFQNRRARLKTKQIEREYNELRASYNALASSFESVQKENQALLIKLQQLKQRMQHKNGNGDQSRSTNCEKSKTMHIDSESKEDNSNTLIDNSGKEDMLSTNQDSTKAESTREETELLNLTRYRGSSIASTDWNNFESTTFLNESSSSSQWWEF